jgi:hypothetical protein
MNVNEVITNRRCHTRWHCVDGNTLPIGVQILDADPPAWGINIAGRMTNRLLDAVARHPSPGFVPGGPFEGLFPTLDLTAK